jgi:hypothetical protein
VAVVERVQTMRTGGEGWGSDLLSDVVLRSLATEGWQGDLTVYFGRSGPARPFSFFPARHFDQPSSLFARPKLALRRDDGCHNSGQNQGVKITCGLREAQRDAVWQEVARQVTEQGCVLGYYALPPAGDRGGRRPGGSRGTTGAAGALTNQVALTIRPWCSVILGSISTRRWVSSRAGVSSSSSRISRRYRGSAASIAASLRSARSSCSRLSA